MPNWCEIYSLLYSISTGAYSKIFSLFKKLVFIWRSFWAGACFGGKRFMASFFCGHFKLGLIFSETIVLNWYLFSVRKNRCVFGGGEKTFCVGSISKKNIFHQLEEIWKCVEFQKSSQNLMGKKTGSVPKRIFEKNQEKRLKTLANSAHQESNLPEWELFLGNNSPFFSLFQKDLLDPSVGKKEKANSSCRRMELHEELMCGHTIPLWCKKINWKKASSRKEPMTFLLVEFFA